MRLLKRTSFILVLLLLCLGCNNLDAQQRVKGIDVSHRQKSIDWKRVAQSDIDFVYIKATEGATYKDPRFDENMKGALSAGLPVGAYHYFRMTSSPKEQFNNFKNAISKYKFQLIPMIDVETDDGKPVAHVQKCLDEFIALVKAEYGVMPMIYGTQRSYNTYCAPKYNNLHLYIGRYGKNEPQIIGKGTYTIWQYSETGRVDGISKEVDLCIMNKKYNLKNIMMPSGSSSR